MKTVTYKDWQHFVTKRGFHIVQEKEGMRDLKYKQYGNSFNFLIEHGAEFLEFKFKMDGSVEVTDWEADDDL